MKISLLKNHQAPAFLGVNFKYSYSNFLDFVGELSLELPKGFEKAAIFSENSPQWVVAFYSVWNVGSAVVPIDAKSSAAEVSYILADSGVELVFTDAAHLDTLKESMQNFEKKPQIILMDGFCQKTVSGKFVELEVLREAEDLAVIVYTSGTTGNPKGVMLNFANLSANVAGVTEAGYFYESMRVLIMLPFHHVLPLMGTMIAPIYVGGAMIFPESLAVADISAVLKLHPATMVVSVPRFYELIHANIKDKINRSKLIKCLFKISKLVGSQKFSRILFGSIHRRFGGQVRHWITGGAALQKEVWADLSALGFSIFEGYGMTECAPIITFPQPNNVKIGAAGQALRDIEIRIVDGEIVVRGPNVTKGYYGKPEETSASIRNGWLYTGDIGYFDEDGFLFITGRRKEIIVLDNGKNVDPSELEFRIKEMDSNITEVGVTMYEDVMQAIICLKEPFIASMSDEDLQKYVRDNIILKYNRGAASYKRILRFVTTSKELPRTRVGKLKRFHLPAYFESIKDEIKQELPLNPEPDGKIYQELKDLIKSQISVAIMPDAHIEMDLGLDSLGKISLQCHISENYGVQMNEKDFEKLPTLRLIAEHVEAMRHDESAQTSKSVTWKDIMKSHTSVRLPSTNIFHFVSIIFFRTFVKIFYKVEVVGLENVESVQPVIIAPNHQSYLDAIFAAFPFSKTRLYDIYFFAKLRSIIKSGFIRYYARHSNVIIMDINDNVRDALQKLAKVLSKGKSVVIFPEGTRTRDGEIAEFKQSFAILSKELSVPVVPTLISGAYEALKSRSSLPKYGAKIRVEYLKSMLPSEDDTYESFTLKVKEAITQAQKNLK